MSDNKLNHELHAFEPAELLKLVEVALSARDAFEKKTIDEMFVLALANRNYNASNKRKYRKLECSYSTARNFVADPEAVSTYMIWYDAYADKDPRQMLVRGPHWSAIQHLAREHNTGIKWIKEIRRLKQNLVRQPGNPVTVSGFLLGQIHAWAEEAKP